MGANLLAVDCLVQWTNQAGATGTDRGPMPLMGTDQTTTMEMDRTTMETDGARWTMTVDWRASTSP